MARQSGTYEDRIDSHKGVVIQCSSDGTLIVRSFRDDRGWWVTDDRTIKARAYGAEGAAIIVDRWVRRKACPVPPERQVALEAAERIA